MPLFSASSKIRPSLTPGYLQGTVASKRRVTSPSNIAKKEKMLKTKTKKKAIASLKMPGSAKGTPSSRGAAAESPGLVDDQASVIGGGRAGPGDQTLTRWFSESRPALPEYRRAAQTICVLPRLMAESRAATAAAALMNSTWNKTARRAAAAGASGRGPAAQSHSA